MWTTWRGYVNTRHLVRLGSTLHCFCFVPALTRYRLYCFEIKVLLLFFSGINDMAFVWAGNINSMSFVLFGNQRCWFCFAPASTKCRLFCSEMNDMAFVLLWLLAFVFILQHVICFVPKSTMLILFCSSINNMSFVLFQNEQYGFCFAPPLTTWLFVLFHH